MRAFARLIDDLVYTRSRNAKIALIVDYLRVTPDPDRGWALAALTDAIDLPAVKSATIRALAEQRVDSVLVAMSRAYVGDTAETVALIWEAPGAGAGKDILLSEVVETLAPLSRADAPAVLAAMLDRIEPESRYALLKLATGGMRVGVSARLAKVAFAEAFSVSVDAVDEYWHALTPPYAALFAWGEGTGETPDLTDTAWFRPFMLAHPLEDGTVSLDDFVAEWKWDGIRVELVGTASDRRLFSRGGEEIGRAFPEIVEALDFIGVLDGELMVRGDAQGGEAASFNALQQRLGRKTVTRKMMTDYPPFVRLYDVLEAGGRDLRALPWTERRTALDSIAAALPPDRFDLSRLIDAPDFAALSAIRDSARDAAIEGVMLKRRDSPYVSGRKTGLWYKWKRDPLSADCVMMYAQRGNGRRASFYSDYTFGCWTEDGELLPVGKAYSGFSDEELKWLDRFVRTHTLNRFGPVCEVEKSLVLEVAFDSIHTSKRHKSGLAMRFPRIKRIRRDKPAAEADRIATLQALAT
ncbi:cisplatin damage response ATP-dependent DNA ligase [Sphingobium sufflavum]|uniref:cisplatin damage response ATP-dependent DNA ligase n=1 Tax=Sphingobium sufflavum TaxID=1129547 RepID=UPI001F342E2F|nr:cisplatin damage response ATP-dependent DNA ligase [Sphingobium sufflavum]MCE7795255.1 cisplatin damage response ATP-dependent DNA ligase [Sphingobium sufflavum]